MIKKKTGRLKETFARLRERGEKALITFVTAGDPDIPTTRDIILALERSGADIIELGIPFSDPMADGPTIQASSERAVAGGTHLPDVLALVRDVRKETGVPIVLFGYYNPIFSFGLKRFAREAARAGVDGVLVVDLPAEEADELKVELDREAIDLIFLLTPTSTEERMRLVSGKASGFIYFVSVTGVTGARAKLSTNIKTYVDRVRKFTGLPVGVGFGISSAKQAREVCRYSDGVIVGSAIVNIIARNSGKKPLIRELSGFVKGLKDGISRR
ncbi:MAG: tryptophan synthase subunit alpha [Thermodesulfobacteriota bacterium]